MEISCACGGDCQHQKKSKRDALPGDGHTVCQCRSGADHIKIDPTMDQVAATPGNEIEKESFTGTRPSDTAQNQADLKTRIIQSIKDLPPMPRVVIEIQNLISDLNSDITQLTAIIETDQAIAAKVLKIANSAYYGMSGKISTIHQASILLGYRVLGEIVTMAGAVDILSGSMPGYGYDSEELWRHSLTVAFSAKLIAELKHKNLIHQAHTAGLIHDVGKIILDKHILDHMDSISVYMVQGEKSFLEAERHIFGFDHAEIASEVCRTWKIPDKISLAIGSHHQPSLSNGDELSYIVHVADYIATMGGIGYDDDDALREPETGAMSFLNLKQTDLSAIMVMALEAASNF